MKTKFFLSILLSLITISASAYDWMVDGIAYNRNSDGKTVTVTSGEGFGKTTGSLKIPEKITLGNITFTVTAIANRAFYYCSGLTDVTIGNSVTSIGDRAFYGCSGLTEVTIGNSVTSIGGSAFENCSKLTSVIIPNSVTKIGEWAFRSCDKLKKVHISSLESWCKINFNDSDSNPLYYAHNLYLNGSLVTDLVIPNTVTSIGSLAFRGCSGFTGSLTIPNSVTSIGSSAFNGCSGLTSVTIGNSVTNIGDYAFGECYSLMEIHSKIKQPGKGITYGRSIFYKAPIGGILLFIPKGTKTLYNNTSPWNQFINIVEEDDSGINDIKVDATPTEDVYYNLHGQRVFNPTPGIYIHNGKKELVR